MKRSDLIWDITIALGLTHCEDRSYENMAKIMLELVEKKGMYPPATMVYIDQENGNTLCSEQCVWDKE